MIAYLFWHRAYSTTTVEQYEEALLRQPRAFAFSAFLPP